MKNQINIKNRKKINELSLNKIQYLNNFENFYKDSLEATNSFNSKTNVLVPDSLNDSNNSIKTENNTPKQNLKKENKINYQNLKIKPINDNINNSNINETKKIDYRYYTNYPEKIIDIISKTDKIKKYFWLAVYDKLMKKNKLMDLLNYYEKKYDESDIKEKVIMIKDFDIYFFPNSNKSYIKYCKDSYVFLKLYLLTIHQINLIISYINRIKYFFKENNLNSIHKKGAFKYINNTESNIKYNIIYCMGIYMNTYIYSFSYLPETNFKKQTKINKDLSFYKINQNYPDSKKVAKLVKILISNFPHYSVDFFICYLLSKIKFQNFNEKSKEIKNFIYFKKNPISHFLKSNNKSIYQKKTNHSLKSDSLSKKNNTSCNTRTNSTYNIKIDLNNEKIINKKYEFINKRLKNKIKKSNNELSKTNHNSSNLSNAKNNSQVYIKNEIMLRNGSKISPNIRQFEINKKNFNDNFSTRNILSKIQKRNKFSYAKNNPKINNSKISLSNIEKDSRKKNQNKNIKKSFNKSFKLNKDNFNKGIFVVKRIMTNFQDFNEDSLSEGINKRKNMSQTKDRIKNKNNKIYLTPIKKKKKNLI